MDIFKFRQASPPEAESAESDAAGADTPIAPTPAEPTFDMSALTAPPPAAAASEPAVEGDPLKTLEFKPRIVDQLVTVFDPEIPVNIYELGLIYDIIVDADGLAVIKMTLTAPGCPAAITLPAEVQGKVKSVDGISDARVDVVWDPPWSKDLMSEAAKLQLGLFD